MKYYYIIIIQKQEGKPLLLIHYLCVQQLFSACKLYAYAEHLKRLLKLCNRGERRRNADIPVTRVFTVRESRPCGSEDDTRLLAKRRNPFRTAVNRVKRDKIAAVRLFPFADSKGGDFAFKRFNHDFKLRSNDCTVLLHMLFDIFKASEKFNMAELIKLVKAD